MLYLLDSNTLIDANRDYYPIGKVNEYWEWLEHQGKSGIVKIPQEMFEEVVKGTDALAQFLKDPAIEAALCLNEVVDVNLVRKVTEVGYAPDLTDIEVDKVGRDPFLIAYGIVDLAGRTVVTTEKSKPKSQRANRKIPDVCAAFSVPCCHSFVFNKALNFRTNWKS